MSRYFKQFRPGDGEARRGLRERLARAEMGDAEYEKAAAQGDARTFRKVGAVLILVFGAAVLAVTWLGY